MDIKNFLKNLKANMPIPEGYSFLQKYNFHNDNIFDKEEIEKLKKDITIFAQEDGNIDDLSEEEAFKFYQSLFPANKKPSNHCFSSRDLAQHWLEGLTSLDENMEKLKKEKDFKDLTPEAQELARIFLINNSRLNNSRENDIEEYIYRASYWDKKIDLKEALPKIRIINEIPTFDVTHYDLRKLLNVENLESKVKYMVENGIFNFKDFGDEHVVELLQTSNEEFEKQKKYLNLSPSLTPTLIKHFTKEDDEKIYNRLKEVTEIVNEKESYFDASVIDLLDLPDEEFQKVKQILQKPYFSKKDNITKYIDVRYAGELAQYGDKTTNDFIHLMELEDREEQLGEYDAVELAIMMSETDELAKFIEIDPNFKIANYRNGRYSLEQSNATPNTHWVFDKHGLVETNRVIFNPQTEEYKLETNSKRAHIKQESYFKTNPRESWEASNLLREISTYYDEKNKMLRKVSLTKDKFSGVPQVTEETPDKKVRTLQYTSIDPNTDNIFIQKDFVSPNGTKTAYSYEETPTLMIINYKITDKNNNELMNMRNTFQQVAKDKFISSTNDEVYEIEFNGTTINVFDKTRNKHHTIELQDKISEEDEEGRQIITEMLKGIPGNQLILMDKLPLDKLGYAGKEENYYYNNGVMYPDAIIVGKQEAYTSDEIWGDALRALRSVYNHEFGHFLDEDFKGEVRGHLVSDNMKVKEIFKKELENFLSNSTSIQQQYLQHIINDGVSEKTAETNKSLYSNSIYGARELYFMQFFPETIATISKEIAEVEKKYL